MAAAAQGNGPLANRKRKLVPVMIGDPEGQCLEPLGGGHFDHQRTILPAADREAVRRQDTWSAHSLGACLIS